MSLPSRRPAPYRSVASFAGDAGRLPAELARPIATTGDGRDVTRPFVSLDYEEFRDRRLLGAVDWGVYDVILLDDQVKSCLEQRRSAVVSREWSVLPGDDKDPRSVEAAAAMEANLQALGWDLVTDKMLYAPFYGFAVAELGWQPWQWQGRTLWGWAEKGKTKAIHVRHARRFRLDKEGRLRLLTRAAPRGELLPERKFWEVAVGASDDDTPYGRGLAEWLYWPTLFKRNGIRFWNLFLDKCSVPTSMGKYPRGATQDEIAKLLEALQSIANDSGFVVPEGMAVELLKIAEAGIDFEQMPKYMDEAIAKIILSQTMTTEDGSSRAQGQVHAGVKQELITADADMLTDSFTRGPARWWTDFNFGADVAAPIVVRQVEEETDQKAMAETDEALARIGYVRTAESFRDVYGEGFEKKAPAEAGKPESRKAGNLDPANDDGLEEAEQRRAGTTSFAAGESRPLYVHRRLKNAKALVAWAKEQGFRSTVPPGEMHVTVTFSRRPVDWFAMGQAWGGDGTLTIPAGGPRQVDRLGGEGGIVLLFAGSELEWRNREMRDAGASWDHTDYRPHVTITYDGEGVDLDQVEPYQGELVFGPEIFEAIDDGWADRLSEVSFAEAAALPSGAAAAPRDIVDEAVDAIMADEGWAKVVAPIERLVDELARAASQEEVEAILRREAELADEAPLVESLARAAFAVRMAAVTGQDGAP